VPDTSPAGQAPVRKRRTNEEAYEEGHRAALAEMAQQADEARREGYEAGREDGYEAGMADGIARSGAPQAPLFEAAKSVVEQSAHLDETVIRERIGVLEQERDEELSVSDRELLISIARRRKSAERAQQDAVKQLTRPRTRAPREHVDSGDIHLS